VKVERQATVPGPDDLFVEEALAVIRERCSLVPDLGVVLGSGLGDSVSGDVRAEAEFAFHALPGFPAPTVPGHAGRLVLGQLYGIAAAVFLGRIHLYEGHGIGSTTLIPRLAAALGARALVLTNAAGGLDASLRPGQLMLISDHLNFIGVNPLEGWRMPDGRPAFVELTSVYDPDLVSLAEEAARLSGLHVAKGVYVALPGPSYETPAETRFLADAGAQAVGMSTVPEAVAAVALGMRVLGISCVTNVAGVQGSGHDEVLAQAKESAADLRTLLAAVVPKIGTNTER
jgi:purine-nucleoside phosphorylase